MKNCDLCGSSADDELSFGEFLTLEDVSVHYFCLLLAPLLTTKGIEKDEGIRGFLLEDIRKECKRVKPIRCKFCKKTKANLGCCHGERCHFAYHLECGIQNQVSIEFCDNYATYCHKHSPSKQTKKPRKADTCGICQEEIQKSLRPILAPCCKGSWFHHECLQKAAMVAGVFAKCPLCNDKDDFRTKLQRMGIFFPDKDADWELDRTIFDGRVDTSPKLCEKCGNTGDLNYSVAPWLWKSCCVCGAGAVHVSCSSDPVTEDFTYGDTENFTCNSCQTILSKPKVPVTPWKSAKKEKKPSSLPLELSAEKLSTSLDKIGTSKCPPVLKKKFTPWFSDDEQLEQSDEDDCASAPKRNRVD